MEIRDRVLIVEADKNIRSFLPPGLEATHYEVLLAQNGLSAYSLSTSQWPEIVSLDLGLPDLDGMDVIRQIRAYTAIPILVISARTQ